MPKVQRMSFSEFKTSVQKWSTERGIYKHSTALAQALKAVSELGELADHAIKGLHGDMRDDIGDIMVCLVNVAHMMGVQMGEVERYKAARRVSVQQGAAFLSMMMAELPVSTQPGAPRHSLPVLQDSVTALAALADMIGSTLEECCEIAWGDIKDRKGRMVAGGAFVKEA